MYDIGTKFRSRSDPSSIYTIIAVHEKSGRYWTECNSNPVTLKEEHLKDMDLITTKWFNLYRHGPGTAYYESREEAIDAIAGNRSYITTISVEV